MKKLKKLILPVSIIGVLMLSSVSVFADEVYTVACYTNTNHHNRVNTNHHNGVNTNHYNGVNTNHHNGVNTNHHNGVNTNHHNGIYGPHVC